MWIATLDTMRCPILEWCPDGRIEQKKRILVDEAAGVIGVVGDYEMLFI